MTDAPTDRVPKLFALVLLIAGALGLLAAWQLSVDEFLVLKNPQAQLSCTINPFVECTTNLLSPQGRVLGFPNPFIGMMGWPIVITIAVLALAGARLPRWFWIATNIGLAGAMAFCIWLMTQTFFVIGKLCTWCLLTWTVALLALVTTTCVNLARGVFGEDARPAGRFLVRWSPLILILLYLLIAVFIQLKFDLIGFYLR